MHRGQLRRALEITKLALADVNYMPALARFRFDGETVTAFNDIVGAFAECPLKVQGTIEGQKFFDTLNLAPERIHDIEVSVKGGVASLAYKGAKSKRREGFPVGKLSDYPGNVPDIPKDATKFTISPEWERAIRICLLSATTNTVRPELSGVSVFPGKGSVRMYGTDNVSIASCVVDLLDKEKPTKAPFILSHDFVERMQKCITAVRGYVEEDKKETESDDPHLFYLYIGKENAFLDLGWSHHKKKEDRKFYGILMGRMLPHAPIDYDKLLADLSKGHEFYQPYPQDDEFIWALNALVMGLEGATGHVSAKVSIDGKNFSVDAGDASAGMESASTLQLSKPWKKTDFLIDPRPLRRGILECHEIAYSSRCVMLRSEDGKVDYYVSVQPKNG